MFIEISNLQQELQQVKLFQEPKLIYVQQLLEAQKQTQLLENILAKVLNSNQRFVNSASLQPSLPRNLKKDAIKHSKSACNLHQPSNVLPISAFFHQEKFKFGSLSSKSLREVNQKCSNQTYQYFCRLIEQKKKSLFTKLFVKNYQGDKSSQRTFILETELQKQKKTIEYQQEKIKKLSQQILLLSRKLNQFYSYEKQLLKKQECLIYQKKSCKSLQAQTKTIIDKLTEIREALELKFSSTKENFSLIQNQKEAYLNFSKQTAGSFGDNPEISELWRIISKFQELYSSLS